MIEWNFANAYYLAVIISCIFGIGLLLLFNGNSKGDKKDGK